MLLFIQPASSLFYFSFIYSPFQSSPSLFYFRIEQLFIKKTWEVLDWSIFVSISHIGLLTVNLIWVLGIWLPIILFYFLLISYCKEFKLRICKYLKSSYFVYVVLSICSDFLEFHYPRAQEWKMSWPFWSILPWTYLALVYVFLSRTPAHLLGRYLIRVLFIIYIATIT